MTRILVCGEGTRCEVRLWAMSCGGDWSVTLCGGGKHHVGAAALAVCDPPRPGRPPSATVSSLCAPAHRDDVVARAAAKELSAALGCNVAVTAGIHVDGASPEELALLQERCHTLCQTLLKEIEAARKPPAGD